MDFHRYLTHAGCVSPAAHTNAIIAVRRPLTCHAAGVILWAMRRGVGVKRGR